MQTARLYLLLLAGVLLAIGCSQDRSNSESARAAPDTSTAAAAPTDAPASPDTTAAGAAAGDGLRVLVLGNSIAAGLGVSSNEAFPARLQQKVDSLGWNVRVQNAGVSGETSAGGLRRIGWLLSEEVDVLVLELGGNDGLRGVPPADTKANLTGIIDTTLATYPEARVLLTAMRIPKNLGADYTEQFREVYPAVAEQHDRASLVEFDRRLQAGADSLMQDDGIHPTAAGHRLVARDVWAKLRPLLEEMRARKPA
jgi:acyl-CoA thioesterase-1